MRQVLQMGTANTLYFDIPEGRPTTAVLNVRTSANGAFPTAITDYDIHDDFSGNVDTTLNSAVLEDAQSLVLTSAVGVDFNKSYFLGECEWVKVKSISGTTVNLYRRVQRPFASGAKFQSTKLDCVIALANCATQSRRNRATVAYTVAGVSRVRSWLFDILPHIWYPSLTSREVYDAIPHADAFGFEEQQDFQEQIDKAAEDLYNDLASRQFDLHNLMEADRANAAHLERVLATLSRPLAFENELARQWYEDAKVIYELEVEKLVSDMDMWYERGVQDLVASESDEVVPEYAELC